jgi:hypothetical protein
MWQEISIKISAFNTHAHTHGRKTIYVQLLWPDLLAEGQLTAASGDETFNKMMMILDDIIFNNITSR